MEMNNLRVKMLEHITHKISSLQDEKTLCGINVRTKPEGNYVTLFSLNITCIECRRIYEIEILKY